MSLLHLFFTSCVAIVLLRKPSVCRDEFVYRYYYLGTVYIYIVDGMRTLDLNKLDT